MFALALLLSCATSMFLTSTTGLKVHRPPYKPHNYQLHNLRTQRKALLFAKMFRIKSSVRQGLVLTGSVHSFSSVLILKFLVVDNVTFG